MLGIETYTPRTIGEAAMRQSTWALAAVLLIGFPLLSAAEKDAEFMVRRIWVARANRCVITDGGRLFCQSADGTGPCPANGNISNDPRIEFDHFMGATPEWRACMASRPPAGLLHENYCNSRVLLCASFGAREGRLSDDLKFEKGFFVESIRFDILRVRDGSLIHVRSLRRAKPESDYGNPYGDLTAPSASQCFAMFGKDQIVLDPPSPACGFCVEWDGRSEKDMLRDGRYQFRVEATVRKFYFDPKVGNQPAPGLLTAKGRYPRETTLDCSCDTRGGNCSGDPAGVVPQKPIRVKIGQYAEFPIEGIGGGLAGNVGAAAASSPESMAPQGPERSETEADSAGEGKPREQ